MKRLAIAGAAIVVAGGAFWYLSHTGSFQRIAALETSATRIAAEEASKNFSAPQPLIATGTISGSAASGSATSSYTLTRAGIVTQTNAARAANGNLPSLAENATLDDIAQIRLDDMFSKQYFAHVSPSSSSAVTVASAVGYTYVSLGENLALGIFSGDAGVVTAWMNSPGHRANILDPDYTEIGVAIGEGNFQGDNEWIAVQVFGKPLSDCPPPDATLQAQVKNEQAANGSSSAELQTMRTNIAAMQPQSGDAYNQAVSQYNTAADQYNAALAQTKSDIAEYNTEVDTYNACIGS